jgi:hypothetical protein
MKKFIQICASQNNLFALDEEGDVYQYHFNVKTWVKLTGNRELRDGERLVDQGLIARRGHPE